MIQTDQANPAGSEEEQRVLRVIRGRIVKGIFAPGVRLPTRTALEEEFGVGWSPVQRAFDRLKRDGFVRANRSRGTFVVDDPPHKSTYAIVTPLPRLKRAKSLYYEAIERVAQDFERANPRLRMPIFGYADLDARDAGYQRLLDVIHRHALAGIIFSTTPFRFVDTPVLTEPGIPRIAMMTGGSYHGMPRIEMGQTWMALAGEHLAKRGRKRVAVIVGTAAEPSDIRERLDPLRACGLDVPDVLVQSATTDFPIWASSCAQLLMRGPASERPDALIIHDDNLVEPATVGLRAAGVSVPNDLTVIAHANLPYPPRAHVPVTFLGYRIDRGLRRCMEHIDAQRDGADPANVLTLEPEFADASESETRVLEGVQTLA